LCNHLVGPIDGMVTAEVRIYHPLPPHSTNGFCFE
jgi:hypothetical protein